MANDAIRAAVAANRDVPNGKPGPFQDCRDVVHLAVFFDGTGNNRDADEADKKWSNVARMFDAALRSRSKSIYRVYVSGVGTAFNGDAANWLNSADIWVEDTLGGMGFGAGGARRLRQGDDTVNQRLRDVLIANAKALGGELAKYASASTDKGFSEVNEALGNHRLIKVINMSFFGFSRGAALARAFSNRVMANCEKKGSELLYQSYPMRFNFLGIFDTVASFGVPAQNVRLPFEERELIVSPLVERCVHYVAAHEVRFAFPVDLIRKDGKLAGEWVESTYPGVHSDVGGGYDPQAQGVDNNYARIPMRDMMRESVTAGVRMMAYDEIKKTSQGLFKQSFECQESTESAYRQYMAACGPMSGTIENQMKRHLEVFYSANGTMHRQGMETPGERGLKQAKYKYIGPKGMAWEIAKYRLAVKAGKWVRFGGKAINGYAQYVKPQDWQISAWDQPATPGVVDFVARFIHDSKVDFIGNLAEPFSYFKPRGVQESTISVWQEWGSWMASKRDDATQAVGDAYESGKKTVGDTYDAGKKEVGEAYESGKKAAGEAYESGKKAAGDAYDAGKKEVVEAVDATTKAAKDAADATRRKAEEAAAYAQRKAEEAAAYARHKADQAAAAAKRAYDATAKAAHETAEAAQHKAEEAAAYARRQAHAAAQAAGDAYDATAKAGKDAAAAGGKKIDAMEEGAEKLYDRGMNWIKRTVKDANDTLHGH